MLKITGSFIVDLLHGIVVIVAFLLSFVEVIPHVSNDGTNLTH